MGKLEDFELHLKLSLENDEFQTNTTVAVGHILDQAKVKIRDADMKPGYRATLKDSNGNTCGTLEVVRARK
jgi:hypothetical protein